MPQYSPNISWLLPELPFHLRPKAVAEAGFDALEFGFPSRADVSALEAAKNDLGLRVVLFNQDLPVWDSKNRGYLSDPDLRDEFRSAFDASLEIARRLGACKIMLPAGVVLPGTPRAAQRACMIENLTYAAPLAKEAGVMLTTEVLNDIDNPGYFLTSALEAADIVRDVGDPSVRYLLDTYHIRRGGRDPSETIRRDIDCIGHIQFADFPGRHEPGTGNIDFVALEQVLLEGGYQDWIGLEYNPQAKGAKALEWAARRQHRSVAR